jgi:hypothetical protein
MVIERLCWLQKSNFDVVFEVIGFRRDFVFQKGNAIIVDLEITIIKQIMYKFSYFNHICHKASCHLPFFL